MASLHDEPGWTPTVYGRFFYFVTGFSNVHCNVFDFDSKKLKKLELGVKTQKNQVQKMLSVFTQYWFLRAYI